MSIDASAQIHESVKLGKDVKVGPWTVIGPNVDIGDGCEIGSHVVIKQNTRMGQGNVVHPFASIGGDHQAKAEDLAETTLEIGDENVFHEYCTLNRGSSVGTGVTKIANRCLLMAYTHVAHDCELADDVILVNHATLGGHVVVGAHAIMGAYTAAHQFCQIGAHSFLTRGCLISKDVMPYVVVSGNPPKAGGLNKVGLRRRGFDADQLSVLDRAYRIIFRQGLTKDEALDNLQPLVDAHADLVTPMFSALKDSERGLER